MISWSYMEEMETFVVPIRHGTDLRKWGCDPAQTDPWHGWRCEHYDEVIHLPIYRPRWQGTHQTTLCHLLQEATA